MPFPFPGHTGILRPSASLIVMLGPCDLDLRHRNVRRRICANSKQACPQRPPCNPAHLTLWSPGRMHVEDGGVTAEVQTASLDQPLEENHPGETSSHTN